MTDYRSEAEKFVTDFLDYVYEHDILDKLNKQTQRMERSPGVQALVKQAEAVFPSRIKRGQEAPALTDSERQEAIESASNVVDTREMFSKKMQQNGGARKLLRALYNGEEGAPEAVKEFLAAEDGTKEFKDGK
jgi:hypothetical protein